jgi:diguanylate cyclase (GGDEF)-like protein
MGRKILLLETDEQLRALIVPLLEARDFVVEQETSGHKAMELIPELKPDLVMVGEELTDIDGVGFIIKLRMKEKEMKVVFISQTWRDAEFFQKIMKELKVAHIFHRPIKSSVFGVQVDALWHDQRRGLPHVSGSHHQAIPTPMGTVPTPMGTVPTPMGTVPTPMGAVPAPMGTVPTPGSDPHTLGTVPVPVAASGRPDPMSWPGPAVPGSGNTPWPSPNAPANYQFPGLENVNTAAPPLPVQSVSLPLPGASSGQQTLPVPVPGASASASAITAFADATLLNFRQKFSKSLPSRLKQIEQIIEQVDRSKPDPNLLIEGRRLSHNLKGTSRSCGFDNLGNLAERMECSLRDMLEVANVNHAAEWENVDVSLVAAKKEVELVRAQFSDYVPTAEELANLNPDAAKAKVLVVSTDFPDLKNTNGQGSEEPHHHSQGIPFEVIKAENSAEALERALRTQLDAALIEITPENRDNAFQLARELRSMVGYETLPLGFISPNDEGDRAEATHAGASLFLEKPFHPEHFKRAMQHLITIREGGRSRVLIVDDDPDFTELITSTLGNEGMLVKALNDPTTVLEVLEEFTPDLMLLDVMMPGILGFDVCRKVRGTGRWQDLPIIFLTAQTDLASRLSAFDSGGDDYLPKPVINVELLKRVKVRLDRARMQRERQDRDLLTGLLLRRAFVDHISALLSESERHKFCFSLCLMDVDHFKKVNDHYGHMAGDRVLAYFGKLLRKRFRVEDLRGRWGGEEFILAFKHESKETMQKALNRVLEELKKVEFKGDEGESFYTSFSAGMVDFPTDGTNIHDLILQADKRLYIAKANGRSQIVING